MRKAFVTGLEGPRLGDAERAFLADARPAGLILFSRNCVTRDQIRTLIHDARRAVGTDDLLVMIDQEGGRVQRLRPPLARMLPPAAAFKAHFDRDLERACRATFLVSRLVAEDLTTFDIDTNCAPILDVPIAGAHDIIGNRAYSRDPREVIALGRAAADGLMAGGILPVMKHMPGHGRAGHDSHLELPSVTATFDELAQTDFAPFKALSDLPAAMTAHVLFLALDGAKPASISQAVTRAVIRGHIGFNGLLISDDLSMKALQGDMSERARQVIAAGTDLVLHCNGVLDEMRAVAGSVPALEGAALARYSKALSVARGPRLDFDRHEAETMTQQLLTPST